LIDTPERWLSGRKRSPAKGVYPETGIEGSNPSLSATSTICDSAGCAFLFDFKNHLQEG
jgi:hypothetical protein